MFNAAEKMSVEASDVQTDEDCDELVDDSFSFSADFLEKRTRGKGSSMKPPSSPRSPYLSSLNMNPRRAAVAAWRLPRASLGDARGDARGDPAAESISARLTSLSNGHDLSQALRPAGDVKATSNARKLKHLHSASNGFSISFSTSDHKDREDMYDEIIRLKKTLHAQKSDNQQMKAKLRRLEEDNAKREKQIEELLDPTKGNDYTRSLVDKKREGSVVVNGLKQRILKLEQQCREKENALSKLQSELRTTNLEELRITVDTYSEEIQRLRTLLYAAEKSSRAESKCSQRQQKALSSTVHRLTESVKQLQQENMSLREELNTDGPAGGVKGYREWSKQRLLRRLLELEKRAEDGRGSAHAEKSGGRLDREVQATPTEILWSTMATEAVVSVATMTEEGEELSDVREQLSQLEKERAELQEALARKDDEVKQLKTEREEVEKETERWKNKHMKEQDTERQQHQQQLQQLQQRIQNLEDQVHRAGADLSSELSSAAVNHQDGSDTSALRESEVTAGQELEEEEGDVETKKRQERRHKDRDRAAKIIQSNWRQHRTRDIVLLQSVLRGHVLRESQLRDLQTTAHNQSGNVARRSDGASSGGGDMDVVALTMIQSVFRGHMARCRLSVESSAALESAAGNSLRSLASRRVRSSHNNNRTGPSSVHNEDKNQNDGDKPRPISGSHVSGLMPTAVQPQLCCTDESGEAAAIESDDSDDIIVSPSRPLRSREVLML